MSRPKAASRLDLLIVNRAIVLAPPDKLSHGDKGIIAAIVAHFNEDTGQCDPSVGRLATLLGVAQDTIFRAINKAVALGLITRKSYGGKSHRNLYTPNWDACLKVVRDAEEAARQARANYPSRRTVKASREQPHGCGSEQPHGCGTNEYLDKRDRDLRRRQVANPKPKQGQAEGGERDQRQGYLVHVVPGRNAVPAKTSRGSPRGAAEARLNSELAAQSDKLVLWQSTPDAWERAVDAEMHRRGAGLVSLRLDPARLTIADAKAAGFG